MTTYVVPPLDEVDFAVAVFTPADTANPSAVLQAYSPLALDGIDFALTAHTRPTFVAVDFELGDAVGNGDIDLSGAAIAGAAADGVLDVGVELGGDALAGASGDAALDVGIELAGDAVASAQAEATLDSGGEEVPEAPWSGGFPILTPPRRRSRRKQDEDAIATFVTIH
jgi:hypothetical protein